MARLGKLATVGRCPTAEFAVAGGMDLEWLVDGTSFHEPAGIPRSAFERGARMERRLREHGGAELIRLCREHLDFDLSEVAYVDLRTGYPVGRRGLEQRARATRQHLRSMFTGEPTAPNLLDGAVLAYRLRGRVHYAEADALGLRCGHRLHVIELKSHPFVDGQVFGGAQPAWMLQMALYLVFLHDLAVELGFDPDTVVSTDGLLVMPRNTSMTPTARTVDLRAHVRMARRTRDRLETIDTAAILAALDSTALPAHMPDAVEDPDGRIAAVENLLDTVGTCYGEACVTACPLYRLCRERARGRVESVGPAVARALPSVGTFAQVRELAESPAAAAGPAGELAPDLQRAARDLDRARELARQLGVAI